MNTAMHIHARCDSFLQLSLTFVLSLPYGPSELAPECNYTLLFLSHKISLFSLTPLNEAFQTNPVLFLHFFVSLFMEKMEYFRLPLNFSCFFFQLPDAMVFRFSPTSPIRVPQFPSFGFFPFPWFGFERPTSSNVYSLL